MARKYIHTYKFEFQVESEEYDPDKVTEEEIGNALITAAGISCIDPSTVEVDCEYVGTL
jgi:hypothetical protein